MCLATQAAGNSALSHASLPTRTRRTRQRSHQPRHVCHMYSTALLTESPTVPASCQPTSVLTCGAAGRDEQRGLHAVRQICRQRQRVGGAHRAAHHQQLVQPQRSRHLLHVSCGAKGARSAPMCLEEVDRCGLIALQPLQSWFQQRTALACRLISLCQCNVPNAGMRVLFVLSVTHVGWTRCTVGTCKRGQVARRVRAGLAVPGAVDGQHLRAVLAQHALIEQRRFQPAAGRPVMQRRLDYNIPSFSPIRPWWLALWYLTATDGMCELKLLLVELHSDRPMNSQPLSGASKPPYVCWHQVSA